MSLLRRYLVPIFAACITLAVGIALGAGPLQQAEGNDDGESLRAANTKLREAVRDAGAARVLSDELTTGIAARLLEDRLQKRDVTIFVLPGVDEEAVTAMETAVTQAGGSAVVVATLDKDVVDPGKKTYVGSVATSSLEALEDIEAPPADQAYARFGLVLARAYVGTGDGVAFGEAAIKIDSEIRGAKLVTLSEEPSRRGSAVVVMSPGASDDSDVTGAQHTIVTDMLRSLAPAADAVVVTTPATGRDEGGLLDVLAAPGGLDAQNVSTVNAGSSPGGTLIAVYALSAALSGNPGDFGVIDGEPVLPEGL